MRTHAERGYEKQAQARVAKPQAYFRPGRCEVPCHLVPTLCVGTHWMAAPRPRNLTYDTPTFYGNEAAERPTNAYPRGAWVREASASEGR